MSALASFVPLLAGRDPPLPSGRHVLPWGSYVPIYDLDPIAPGPGPYPYPFYFNWWKGG